MGFPLFLPPGSRSEKGFPMPWMQRETDESMASSPVGMTSYPALLALPLCCAPIRLCYMRILETFVVLPKGHPAHVFAFPRKTWRTVYPSANRSESVPTCFAPTVWGLNVFLFRLVHLYHQFVYFGTITFESILIGFETSCPPQTVWSFLVLLCSASIRLKSLLCFSTLPL